MRIAIIAALPGELKQLVNTGWARAATKEKLASKWISGNRQDVWIAVCAGMGADAARRAFIEAEAEGALDIVLSVGWAGALADSLIKGQAYVASMVVDAQTGERFDLGGKERELILVSASRVAQQAEKRRLAETYKGSMVDMESAAIVRLAQMRGIPVCCIKAISDSIDDQIPIFKQFIDQHGQMKMLHFVLHLFGKPRYWGPLIRLGRASAKGADALASAVLTLLTGPKDIEEINRTGNVDW